jgi:hypothetical protein
MQVCWVCTCDGEGVLVLVLLVLWQQHFTPRMVLAMGGMQRVCR